MYVGHYTWFNDICKDFPIGHKWCYHKILCIVELHVSNLINTAEDVICSMREGLTLTRIGPTTPSPQSGYINNLEKYIGGFRRAHLGAWSAFYCANILGLSKMHYRKLLGAGVIRRNFVLKYRHKNIIKLVKRWEYQDISW